MPISKAVMSLPKCLDNVIRFQILSPYASSSASLGEVSILTEPKMLPLPLSTFRHHSLHGPKSRLSKLSTVNGISKTNAVDAIGMEDGWEDGEDPGCEDQDSGQNKGSDLDESEGTAENGDGEGTAEDEDEEGSWLQGRFPRSVIRA